MLAKNWDSGQKVCRYLFVRCDNEPAPWTSDEHGDHPRSLPAIKELSGATDVTDRKDTPSWDYDEEESCWKWKKPPPPSKKSVLTDNLEDIEDLKRARKAWEKAKNKSLTYHYMKGFKCQLCEEVMTLPLTTPCAHNFCKPCLENVFAGKASVRERSSHGRTLRAQKIIMKCPSCPMDLSEFLQNPQVNRELMGVIEDLQRKAKEENEEDSSEELDKPENMTVAAEEGSDNSDVTEGNQETEDEPKQKRLKTEASYLSENIDGSEFKSDESAAEEMKLDVADGNNVVENHAAEESIAVKTKLKEVASKPVPRKIVSKKETKKTAVSVVDDGNDSPSSPLQIGSDDNIE